MANVVVVGAQWGDEGKGKIVDWLSEQADIVVRFQGGHNAGHTLVIDGVTYKLALLPSGVVRGGKLSVIGNGVVVDPWHLVDEIERIKAQGVEVSPASLRIADNATLILPLHRELDHFRETANAGLKIGTTKRGIGPAYEDKVGRRAIRVVDLADPDALPAKIERVLTHHNALRRGLGIAEVNAEALLAELTAIAPKILPYRRHRLGAARRGAAGRQAHPVRGRAGRAARRRPRHLSLRHLVQHRGGAGGDGLGPRPGGDRLRAGHRQGLHDPRGRGPVPHRAVTTRSARPSAAAAASSASTPAASAAAAGSTPCWCARRFGRPASTASP